MSDPTRSSAIEERTDSVDVSVVIPVHNAMPYLHELLESLAGQDLPADAYEVIAVNDGSTDDSGAELDAFAERHPNVRVVHQENTGWPGGPRNRGLDLARGRYVFFADADDRLGTEALRRMVAYADEHAADVVVPKMIGLGGRFTAWRHPQAVIVDADLELVLKSLAPQKLFRRSMLADSGIRFPEGKIRLEDGMMLTRAYYAARRVSTLGDYDYYFIRKRDDGQNISRRRLDPHGYTWSIGEVSRLVKEHDPDPARANRIILDLYRRKCLKMYAPRRFAKMQDIHRDQWIREHQRFIAEFIPPELESGLNHPSLLRSQLVRAGDKAGLLKLARLELGDALPTLVDGRWSFLSRSLQLDLELELKEPEDGRVDLVMHLQDRDSESWTEVELTDRDRREELPSSPQWPDSITTRRYTVRLPRKLLRRRAKTVINVFVQRTSDAGTNRTRVTVMEGLELPAARKGIQPHRTIKDNLSIRVRP